MPHYIIDNHRRVWAECLTKGEARRALKRLRADVRAGRVPRFSDPAQLRRVEWDGLGAEARQMFDLHARVT